MSVNQLSLELDTERLVQDLIKHLVKAVDKAADELAQAMISRIQNPDVRRSIKRTDVQVEGYELIRVLVGSDHWMAFIENYGSGSKMDLNNPGLAAYMESEYYNKEREKYGRKIIGRRPPGYKKPDYKRGTGYVYVKSTGRNIDKNGEPIVLEGKLKKFDPVAPKRFMEASMLWMRKRFAEIIKEAIREFPAHRYLKGGG